MQQNLRELLKEHRVTSLVAASIVNLSPSLFSMHVLNSGRVRVAEVELLARYMDVKREVVEAALAETRRRPGRDGRGRKKSGGKRDADAEGHSGLGQTGHGPLPAQMSA